MTPELTALTLAALLQVVQYVLLSVPANLELGTKRTLSPRDDGRLEDDLSPRTARLARALQNHFEALILFTIAVLVVTFADKSDEVTAVLSALYLVARVLYIPAYYYGLSPWRSLIWFAGFGATVLLLLKALL